MKTFLCLLTLTFMATGAFAQGTIAWGNNALTRILVSFYGEPPRNATAEDGLTFGLFFGPAGSSAEALMLVPPTAMIGAVPGILAGAATVFPLPSTESAQTVSVQVRAWVGTGLMLEGPPVRQVTLGPTAGPGAVIWTTDPAGRTFYLVPEPSSLTLSVLAGALLLFRLRKTTKPN